MAATEQDINSGKMSRWYKKDLEVDQSMREILETYGGIPPDQVLSHVNTVVRFPYSPRKASFPDQ